MGELHYHFVYIERLSSVTLEDVEVVMDSADDWYRLRYNVWILYSDIDSDVWYEKLSPLVKESGSVFICRLNPKDRQGWMTKKFWSWLRREDS